MGKQFQPFFLISLILVMVSLPTLQGSRRILQTMPPAPGPSPVPSVSPSPGPSAPSPSPSPGPTPKPSPSPSQQPPAPPTGGGGGSGGGGSGGSGSRGNSGGSSRLSGGQKAGIVIGVLAGAGLIAFATLVYMKRRSNIRRARFGVLARRSQL